MTYRAGIGPGIPGLEPGPPHIFCDGCGLKFEVHSRFGGAPAWFLDGKAPKGWQVIASRTETGLVLFRLDWCPKCRTAQPRCCDECAHPGCHNVGHEMTTMCHFFVRIT
jgi:hypothetical protein